MNFVSRRCLLIFLQQGLFQRDVAKNISGISWKVISIPTISQSPWFFVTKPDSTLQETNMAIFEIQHKYWHPTTHKLYKGLLSTTGETLTVKLKIGTLASTKRKKKNTLQNQNNRHIVKNRNKSTPLQRKKKWSLMCFPPKKKMPLFLNCHFPPSTNHLPFEPHF